VRSVCAGALWLDLTGAERPALASHATRVAGGVRSSSRRRRSMRSSAARLHSPAARHPRREVGALVIVAAALPRHEWRRETGTVVALVDVRPMTDARVTMSTFTSSAPRRRERPMLLVHGFLATPRVVGRLAARLGRFGYCAHGVDLGGLFGRFNARPVEELARVVAERVEQLARDHRCERIDLVGHSEGGLIGRYYVQKLGGASRVRHLVTLGTPHRGTRWAHWGHLVRRVLPSLRQMAPGSSLLRDLTEDGFPASVRLTSIYSRRDSLCPPSSCRLEVSGAPHLKNVEVTRGGHLDLLFSDTIPSLICRELESAEPSVPTRRQLISGRLISSASESALPTAPFAHASERAVA